MRKAYNETMKNSVLKIFYDGGCRVCAWEIEKYLAADTLGALGTIDINHPDFAAQDYGLDAARVRKYFHVLTLDGKIIVGVDAFIAIWDALGSPMSRRAAKLARLSLPHRLLEIGYSAFVRIRPYLPRRGGTECKDGSCDWHH